MVSLAGVDRAFYSPAMTSAADRRARILDGIAAAASPPAAIPPTSS